MKTKTVGVTFTVDEVKDVVLSDSTPYWIKERVFEAKEQAETTVEDKILNGNIVALMREVSPENCFDRENIYNMCSRSQNIKTWQNAIKGLDYIGAAHLVDAFTSLNRYHQDNTVVDYHQDNTVVDPKI